MAEILATLAMVYAAKSFCDRPKSNYVVTPTPPQSDHRSTVMSTKSGGYDGVGMNPYEKQEMPSFGEVAFMRHVNGDPVYDFRDRPYVSGKMNNLSPAEKNLVGPGLNMGADVPAYGGYQQLFRVKPNNVGSYRLTTLPGRSGPAGDVTGGRGSLVGHLTHDKPETTAYLPSRYPTVPGRAQSQGGSATGMVPRGEYQKTKRPTNRSETTLRTDGLGFSPAKKFISQGTLAQDPTSNKGDTNILQYGYNNHPAPGITNFHGGYINSPASKAMKDRSNLAEYGLRPSERRGNKDRPGNAGRMNVRTNPLSQHGMITAVRSDTSRMDGWSSPVNGGWGQNYVKPQFQNNNAYKGNVNPHATGNYLNTAVSQLKTNPFAHSLSG